MDKNNIYLKSLTAGAYIRKCDTSELDLLRLIKLIQPYEIGYPLQRIGDKNDGGYLIPDQLEGLAQCFSPGVGDDSSFEFELAKRGLNCYLADHSVEGPAIESERFYFTKKFISNLDDASCISFENWINQTTSPCEETLDSILSVDIEGSEIELFLSNNMKIFSGFRFIVMELHFLERIAHKAFYDFYYLALQKLTKDFLVCHLHPNNCSSAIVRHGITIPPTLELTLVNRKIINSSATKPVISLPHPLDRKNIPNRPDIQLSNHWFATN